MTVENFREAFIKGCESQQDELGLEHEDMAGNVTGHEFDSLEDAFAHGEDAVSAAWDEIRE